MRREGFELSFSRPRALMREHPDGGAPPEPFERVQIGVDDTFVGEMVNTLAELRAQLIGFDGGLRTVH